MGIISIIGSCFVFLWLCLPYLGHEVTVSPVTSFPSQPVENGHVTLTCYAFGFDPNVHLFSWQRSNNVDVEPDHRISFSPAILFAETELGMIYSQNLTITKLTKPDEGFYLCCITRKDNGNVIANGQGGFSVNSSEEFPVCFPDGPAVVRVGDTLSCRTVSDERDNFVIDSTRYLERTDWVHRSTPVCTGTPGSELQMNVTLQENGTTFLCFSFISATYSWKALSCKIGPLMVKPYVPYVTPDTDTQTSTHVPTACPSDVNRLSPVGIAGIAGGVLVILVTIVVNMLCCRYDPSRWQQLLSTFNTKTLESSSNVDTTNLNIRSELRNNKQDGTKQHSYANVVVNAEPSSQLEGETSFICSDQSLSQGGVKSTRGLPSNRLDGQDKDTSSRQADPYMELNIVDQKPALYTELKL